MAQVPDYSGLEAQWQADCYNWNTNITVTNHRLPALSNPPMFLKLFNDGYDTFEDLKAELDVSTKSAGWLTLVRSSKANHATLICSRGAMRPSTATTNNTSTIKAGCRWQAIAHATKQTLGKWKLVISEHRHSCHGPQEVPEAQRGWVKLTDEHHDFLARTARDPSLAKPKKLEAALRREYPGIQLGPNMMKDWLASFRKEKQGIYTPTQAALNFLEEKGCWYQWARDAEGRVTGIFWCEKQQMAWIRERRFSRCLSLDCTYSTNNKKMPYFQGTAITHTKKNLPLFQGIVDNERETGFRWLLEQEDLLVKEYEADDPTLLITDYDNALINAVKHEFPQAHHQLCIFHMNMNIVLNIKKKWRKPMVQAEGQIEEEAEDAEEEESEAATASLNAPARNKATIPTRVPELKDIPYTRQALFNLVRFMEYSIDREVYETAWQRLQEKFSLSTNPARRQPSTPTPRARLQ